MRYQISIIIFLTTVFYWGCLPKPPYTAWEHLAAALELDEERVIEYIASEYLPAIVSTDPQRALEEAVYTNPEAAARWMVDQYGEIVADNLDLREFQHLVDNIITQRSEELIERLFRIAPDYMLDVAVRTDPYILFDKVIYRDLTTFIRRAIDQDPRYAARYLRTYYGEF